MLTKYFQGEEIKINFGWLWIGAEGVPNFLFFCRRRK